MASLDRLKVLYVDDEKENLDLFRMQFGDEFAVVTAPNGAAALKVLEEEAVGLLLTDERMPGMSGVELLAKALQSYPEVTRVIVSAFTDTVRLLSAINK